MCLFHKHRHVEHFGGLYAEELGGPRTYHEIWWECACGAMDAASHAAKKRAEFVVKHNIAYVKPGHWPMAEMYYE